MCFFAVRKVVWFNGVFSDFSFGSFSRDRPLWGTDVVMFLFYGGKVA